MLKRIEGVPFPSIRKSEEERLEAIERAERREEAKQVKKGFSHFVVPTSIVEGKVERRCVPHNTFLLNLAMLKRFEKERVSKGKVLVCEGSKLSR